MAHIKMPDRNRVADRKMAKLQQQLHNMEQQMEEQAELRRKAEQLQSMETLRMQQAVERANSSNMVLQDEIERLYNSPSPSTSKILEEVMTLRTKEFQKSQAKKAATIKNLAMERQKIMEARNRLREKNDVFRSVPSPIGKETQRYWGHKYSLYTPVFLDTYRSSYLPALDESGYFTYFPRKRRRKLIYCDPDGIFLPVPLP